MHVATTSNEAVIAGTVNLSDYNTVIWISGTESTADHTFDATEQSKLTTFINAGGNLFLSGSEIGWDLDQQNNGRTFYESTLKANYVADDAGTYTATADAGGIFAGMSSFVFSNGTAFSQLDSQMYDVAFPDVIAPQAGAVAALTYSGGTGGTAAIQVLGTGGKGNIVMFAFPFEAMTNASRRQNAMGNILSFLGAEIAIETRVNGQDADSAPGTVLVPGTNASLTYLVTNPGIVSLSTVSVIDDNGTPGNAADDFNATYSSGDANSNGQLDVGETWTYTATRMVVAGQTTRSGKATGTASSTTVTNSDAANYLARLPAIDVKTYVNNQDADSPTGPILAAGSSATFRYVVTNTGNVALGNVVVTDDNGTPGNAADDFNATYSSGDTNGNSLLDLSETWTLVATRTVVAGQFSGVGSVTAQDSIAQAVNDGDAVNYFGSAPAFNVQMSVDGDDADSPPGPTFTAGSSMTFEYVVTNTGNVPLGPAVVDDNGTPENPADDFEPTHVSGDLNFNERMDVGETWTYMEVRTVVAGQHTHTVNANAFDDIGQELFSTDLTSYFVPANADFNSDTFVDAGDYVMWRKNSGITSGAVLGQGDANGDGAVDGIDYDAWSGQYDAPVLEAGAGTSAASGTELAASRESSQAISVPGLSTASVEPSPIKVATSANDVVLAAFASSDGRGTSIRDSVERVRAFVAARPRDWSELLNDLAERKVHRGVVDESAHVSNMRFTDSAESTDSTTQIDCSVTKSLISI